MIWELRCARVNSFAPIVALDRADSRAGLFASKGAIQDWTHRPAVEFFQETRKKPKPRANVIFMKPGALVLDAKAKLALGGFLSKFGQLLELHCSGEVLWFYNVTNMVACVDTVNSERDEAGMIKKEHFKETKVPTEPSVFKDPTMAPIRIYVNDAGRAEIERIAGHAELTGIECGPPLAF
jgi:hypothetical protein